MDIYNFIKQNPNVVPKRCKKAPFDIMRSMLNSTRVFDHWYHLDRMVKQIPRDDMIVLIAMLSFGNDKSLSDILDYCENARLIDSFDYFKKSSDWITFQEFLDESTPWPTGIGCPPDKRIATNVYTGAADVEASVKIGTQQESAEYRDTANEQTLGFSDNQDIMILDMSQPGDSTRAGEDYQDTNSLARFLERPRIIHQATWGIGQLTTINLNVWKLYISAAIEQKAAHFRMFRASGLKLEFRINGSPFHYGRLYAGYCMGPFSNLPYLGMQEPQSAAVAPSNMSSFNTAARPMKTSHSQWPGVFIDPTTNVPQEMVVPFFWPQNYANLVADDIISQMGFVRIWSITDLRHANGATDAITLTVTASLVDPVLTMPTTKEPYTGEAGRAGSGAPKGRSDQRNKRTKAPQSKSSKGLKSSNAKTSGNDEYGVGIVSAPASALASFAGTLEKVPIIGKYATATKIAAGSLSSIASLFGFSKPVDVEHEKKYTYRPNGTLATTSGTDPSEKLTLDPKQEITIDPQTVGLQNIDEMSFAHIFKRESLIVQIPWEETDVGSANLCHLLVSPSNHPADFTGGSEISWHTSLSWGVMPFLYWRGTLRYRFQVVKSQLHRGRLAIVYNPSHESLLTLPDQAETYQQFIDITEQDDVTIDVRYAQPVPWLPTRSPSDAFVTEGAGTFAAAIRRVANGTISVYVLNELASPNGTSPVEINVFVSAGDDFMVAAPGDSTWIAETPYAEQIAIAYTGAADVADDTTEQEHLPVKSGSEDIVLNGTDMDTPDCDNQLLVFFGEQNVSMRALLKRYCIYRAVVNTATTGTFTVNTTTFHHSQFPQSRGLAGNGNEWLGFTQVLEINPICNTYLNFYSRGYLGRRGAVRWKYIKVASSQTYQVETISASRSTFATTESGRYSTNNDVNAYSGTQIENNMLAALQNAQSFAGTALTYNFVNNGIEFEHPFYCPERFVWINLPRHTSATPPDMNNYDSYQQSYRSHDTHEVNFHWETNNVPGNHSVWQMYCASGEDFSLHYYLGAPVLGFQVVNLPA